MKKWKTFAKELEKGKSFNEVTKNVPLAVKIKPRQFKQLFFSSNQQRAIRRS